MGPSGFCSSRRDYRGAISFPIHPHIEKEGAVEGGGVKDKKQGGFFKLGMLKD